MNSKNRPYNSIVQHRISFEDLQFRWAFEAFKIPTEEFDHRAHIRLAYIYLYQTDQKTDQATTLMRNALKSFIEHHEIGKTKYNETITKAWILAVRHHMEITPGKSNSDHFIDSNPHLLDTKILLTHYSENLLFSRKSQTIFMEPDIEPIPFYE
jgi:hypothetical protein